MPSSLLFQQLNTIQSNFGVQPLLELAQLKAFGVDYDRDVLDDLNIILEQDRDRYIPIKKFFTGHLGCGKSTLLSECAYNQEDRYFTVFFSIADFSTYSDIDYTDILFAIGVSMLTAAKQKGIEISRTVRESLDRWFNNIVEVQKEVEGGGFELDLKVLKFKLLRESETREEVRKKFEKKIEDLIGKLNEIAAIITDASNKPILVIIDDLDKISKTDSQMSIYSDNVSALIAPKFSIIYTIPISFYRNTIGMGSLESVMSEPVLLMPVLKLVPKDQRRSIPVDFSSPAIETLCQAIDRRLPDEFKQIIEPEIAREIVLMSGGVFRELIRIVDRCLGVAKKKATHGVHIRNGIGRGNAPKIVGVVHDGHEEVGGWNHRLAPADVVHRRVVAAGVAHQQVGVLGLGNAGVQHLVEHGRRNFAATARTVAVLGEFVLHDFRNNRKPQK